MYVFTPITYPRQQQRIHTNNCSMLVRPLGNGPHAWVSCTLHTPSPHPQQQHTTHQIKCTQKGRSTPIIWTLITSIPLQSDISANLCQTNQRKPATKSLRDFVRRAGSGYSPGPWKEGKDVNKVSNSTKKIIFGSIFYSCFIFHIILSWAKPP